MFNTPIWIRRPASQQPQRLGDQDRVGPAPGIQLAVDAGGVGFDRSQGDDQVSGNLLIGLPCCNQPQDLQLTFAEGFQQCG